MNWQSKSIVWYFMCHNWTMLRIIVNKVYLSVILHSLQRFLEIRDKYVEPRSFLEKRPINLTDQSPIIVTFAFTLLFNHLYPCAAWLCRPPISTSSCLCLGGPSSTPLLPTSAWITIHQRTSKKFTYLLMHLPAIWTHAQYGGKRLLGNLWN